MRTLVYVAVSVPPFVPARADPTPAVLFRRRRARRPGHCNVSVGRSSVVCTVGMRSLTTEAVSVVEMVVTVVVRGNVGGRRGEHDGRNVGSVFIVYVDTVMVNSDIERLTTSRSLTIRFTRDVCAVLSVCSMRSLCASDLNDVRLTPMTLTVEMKSSRTV